MSRISRWYDERVEAYVDGALGDRERRLFEAELALNEALAEAVAAAREIEAGLAVLPRYRCPTDLTGRLARVTDHRPRDQHGRRWMPLAAAATVAALAVGVWLARPFGPVSVAPTAAELAAAQRDLAVALAYLDRANQRVGREVTSQVLSEGLLEPVSRESLRRREDAS